jgi:hypothetical protein
VHYYVCSTVQVHMFEEFQKPKYVYMSTSKPSFYTAVVDNVGGYPIFHAILGNASQFLMRLSKLFLNFL